jgi:hypothetical protein
MELAIVVKGRTEGKLQALETERTDEDEPGENLASATRGEPSINPGKEHAVEENVGGGEDQQSDEGISPKLWKRERDAGGDGECDADGGDVGRREKSEEEAHGGVT